MRDLGGKAKKSKSMSGKSFSEFKLLSEDEVASRRVSLEEAEVSASKQSNWLCSDCNRRFSNENFFMRHTCEPRRKREEFSSPLGQAAYSYYLDWMTLRKYSKPNASAFMESKFFRPFMKFSQLVIDANISRPDRYMELMVEGEVQPMLWHTTSAYTLYTRYLDLLADPLEQVSDSINYLMDICQNEDIELKNIFQHLGVQRLLNLIRQRRLSPWFLFCSSEFGKVIKSIDKSHLRAFNLVVNAEYWGGRFSESKNTVQEIKLVIQGMGL